MGCRQSPIDIGLLTLGSQPREATVIRYFQHAKLWSSHSEHHTYKLGCVIVKKNKIISGGFNKIKTHTKSIHKFNMLHAEIDALIGKDYDKLRNSFAFVYRERKNGKPAMAKPCEACELALKKAGVKRVYYTIDIEPYWRYIDLKENS